MNKESEIRNKINALKKEHDNLRAGLQSDYYMYHRTSILSFSKKIEYRKAVKDTEKRIASLEMEINKLVRELDSQKRNKISK